MNRKSRHCKPDAIIMLLTPVISPQIMNSIADKNSKLTTSSEALVKSSFLVKDTQVLSCAKGLTRMEWPDLVAIGTAGITAPSQPMTPAQFSVQSFREFLFRKDKVGIFSGGLLARCPYPHTTAGLSFQTFADAHRKIGQNALKNWATLQDGG